MPPVIHAYSPLVSINNLSPAEVALVFVAFIIFFLFALAYKHPGHACNFQLNLCS